MCVHSNKIVSVFPWRLNVWFVNLHRFCKESPDAEILCELHFLNDFAVIKIKEKFCQFTFYFVYLSRSSDWPPGFNSWKGQNFLFPAIPRLSLRPT